MSRPPGAAAYTPGFPIAARLRSFFTTRNQLVRMEQIPTQSMERLMQYEVRYLGPKTVLKICGPAMPL